MPLHAVLPTVMPTVLPTVLQAISRTAKHRLERGIWTSPGAGDIRWEW